MNAFLYYTESTDEQRGVDAWHKRSGPDAMAFSSSRCDTAETVAELFANKIFDYNVGVEEASIPIADVKLMAFYAGSYAFKDPADLRDPGASLKRISKVGLNDSMTEEDGWDFEATMITVGICNEEHNGLRCNAVKVYMLFRIVIGLQKLHVTDCLYLSKDFNIIDTIFVSIIVKFQNT